MKTIQFPVNITNRIAYGMSALAIGGRCHLSAAEWALGTGDFPQTSEEQFDSYRPSNGNLLEKRPRHATTRLAWHRDGRPTPYSASGPNFGTNGAKNLGRLTARHSASCVRKLLPMIASASSSPRQELTARLGCACPARSIWKIPTSTSSETYVMGRQTRALNRACWCATLRKPLATAEPRKAGADPTPTADGPAAGRPKNGGRDTKVVGSTTAPPDGTPPARPFIGPTLAQEERA